MDIIIAYEGIAYIFIQNSCKNAYNELIMSNVNIPGLIQGKKSEWEKNLSEAEIQNERIKYAQSQKYQTQKAKVDALSKVVNNGIPNSMYIEQELTLDQVKEMYPQMDVSKVARHGNQSMVDFNSLLNNYGAGTSIQPDWTIPLPYTQPYQQPYQQPMELDDYKKLFTTQPKKYGPSPSRTGKDDFFDQKALMDYLKPKRSAFEEILDVLFTTAEKEQFLIDVGYELIHNAIETTVTRKLSDGTVKTIKGSVDEVFLKEITVKFKGLLLAKGTLRIKFPDVQTKENQETAVQPE